MRTVVLVAILAGCGSTPKPAADPETPPTASLVDCDAAATHVAQTAQTAKLRSGATYEAVQKMVSTRCKTDAWSDETKRCLYAIKTIAEGRDCAKTMTDAQREAIHTDVVAMRKESTGPVEAEDHSGDWLEHVVEAPAPKPATK